MDTTVTLTSSQRRRLTRRLTHLNGVCATCRTHLANWRVKKNVPTCPTCGGTTYWLRDAEVTAQERRAEIAARFGYKLPAADPVLDAILEAGRVDAVSPSG